MIYLPIIMTSHIYLRLKGSDFYNMIEIIQFVLVSLLIGVLLSIPGVLFGYWLKKRNIAPNRWLLTIIFCVVLVFAKRIWLPNLSYYWFSLILIAGSALGLYRMDIYWASKKSKE